MQAPVFTTPENVSYWLGFAPAERMTASSGTLSAAIWNFADAPVYELRGPAVENTDLVSIPISGQHHHTYFGNGRRKWSRAHPPLHMNIVVAGEEPRGIFQSERPFSYLHVYVPHAMIERIAVESGAIKAGRTVTLIDPMCSWSPLVEDICRGIVRELRQRDGCSRMMIESLGNQLAVRLLRQHSSVSGSVASSGKSALSYRDWRLRRAIDYLEAHLSADVGLEEIAGVVGLSAGRVTELFRQGTGETPHRWLMNRRLTRACELLANPALKITEIAHQCGFASSQHFAVVMRRRLGVTPTAYRRQILT
ncbi:AraC family transcriptional regulator [Mycobacterium sherrisii]|nr:helix-turn-helix transcriptional regulator [Mycobacterium sherrisii]ORW73668.1 AraC family transcriptional regulator [Mycobacterium sherrisii]